MLVRTHQPGTARLCVVALGKQALRIDQHGHALDGTRLPTDHDGLYRHRVLRQRLQFTQGAGIDLRHIVDVQQALKPMAQLVEQPAALAVAGDGRIVHRRAG